MNNRNQVQCRENANQQIKVVGLTEAQITNVDETMEVIDFGLGSRMTGTTAANADSSRSHAVLQLSIKDGKGKLYGKMSFIDLAGSERGADAADSKKETRMDGAEINKSLLALKECIRALDQSKKHTPFRGSKLTMVLKDSFQGNKCKTAMVANIGPTISCCEHTLNTLRYADRVKELKKENRDQSNALMLPRQANNSKKYDLKRKNSFENKPKLTGLAAIQNNMDNGSKLKKATSTTTRPQTAAFQKDSSLKHPKTGIPGLGGSNLLKRLKNDNANGINLPDQRQTKTPKTLLSNNNAAYENQGNSRKPHHLGFENNVDKMLNENIENAYKLRKGGKKY